jgi:hypothetical protein
MGEFWRRIVYLFNSRRLGAELQADMEFHREMAAHAGHNNFGNMLRIREQAREAWGWTWLDRLVQDLHYGARILARAPGFTLITVLVLPSALASTSRHLVSSIWLPSSHSRCVIPHRW